MPDFIQCCNEPSRAIWLKLMAKFKRKIEAKPKRNIALKVKLENTEEIARLMTIRPGWSKSHGLQ